MDAVLRGRLKNLKSPYNKDEFEEKFSEIEAMKNRDSNEYFLKYMKIIISFGRPVRISEHGYKTGLDLYAKWKKGEALDREENMLAGFLLSDICVLEENAEMMADLNKLYNQMVTTHKPDFQYLQEFGQTHLLEAGYVESNPHYMETVEQMFTTDYVLPDPEQLRMIKTGEMPIYDKVKACPYCGKQYTEETVEDLFKHVKAEHSKK